MARPEKVQIVETMTREFQEAGSVFVADYAGLKVADATELRRKLREAGVRLRVVKNTLLRRAAGEAGLDDLLPFFKGPTAVAMGPDDPIPAARILQEFATRLELPKVRTFRVESRRYEPTDLKILASLPSREVLLAQVVAAVESPISGFVGTLDAIIRELIGTVDALAEKGGAAAAS
ncbi:MAG TPA: 50S ribosomal protein L10 [Acidobacteriota bacterium]|nr:50S ribosomal protein L10 [Acidobacteriota bacterium]